MRFMPGLVLGGAVGAVLAWLYSPKSGRENRQALAERGIELGGRVDELLPGASEVVVERARAVIEEQKRRLERASEEARRAADEARETLIARYEAAKRER